MKENEGKGEKEQRLVVKGKYSVTKREEKRKVENVGE